MFDYLKLIYLQKPVNLKVAQTSLHSLYTRCCHYILHTMLLLGISPSQLHCTHLSAEPVSPVSAQLSLVSTYCVSGLNFPHHHSESPQLREQATMAFSFKMKKGKEKETRFRGLTPADVLGSDEILTRLGALWLHLGVAPKASGDMESGNKVIRGSAIQQRLWCCAEYSRGISQLSRLFLPSLLALRRGRIYHSMLCPHSSDPVESCEP